MAKYCCFWCPASDYSDRGLDEPCPTCGRPFGLPLDAPPKQIGQYTITAPLGRGFYAATFVAERGNLVKTRCVLKVSPVAIYEHFGKDFENECRIHQEVADKTEHIVSITDAFEARVRFGREEVPCYVAELTFVDGSLLSRLLEGNRLNAPRAAQIAIDLLRLRGELIAKGVHHNDLHAQNIIVQELPKESRRANAVDGSIRTVAIDLGSVSDGSKSDTGGGRLGDLESIAGHLGQMVQRLLSHPDSVRDFDFRLALALQQIVNSISADAIHQRTPSTEELIREVEEAYFRVSQPWRPWRQSLVLRTLDAGYNALTIYPWNVPRLLVDPDGQWINGISAPGPQVIIGMRGCGKTILLQALSFHARAAVREDEQEAAVVKRISDDGYVGLFVSAQRLLDPHGGETQDPQLLFARLYVAYALEAVKACLHLADIKEELLAPNAHKTIADAVSALIENTSEVKDAPSLHDLEIRLTDILVRLLAAEKVRHPLRAHPSSAFPHLAAALRRCASTWADARVLYLLDDVSTRFMKEERIVQLLPALLFQDPYCAFKLTSEAQTIELGMRSPGEILRSHVGRDLSLFDLGAAVYKRVKESGPVKGSKFIESILLHRVKYLPAPQRPPAIPSEMLGDVELEVIAREIGESGKSSRKRKGIYRGISALVGMCVGDLGDVITLYDLIVRKGGFKKVPIAAEIQSECFQEFCARRLYDLNRKGDYYKNIAKTFAEASHELLVKSCNGPANEKRRVRQYLSLYVRVSSGNLEWQMTKLRELFDAGVFVFAGGSNVPRTKTRDSNPMQQFKLTYRKVYGLVNFIGLSERDRFELSGDSLEQWLREPSHGKEILLRNLGGQLEEPHEPTDQAKTEESSHQEQTVLTFEKAATDDVPAARAKAEEMHPLVPVPRVSRRLGAGPAKALPTHLIAGLGFEERTFKSVVRVCKQLPIRRATLVEYEEPGFSAAIKKSLRERHVKIEVLQYRDIVKSGVDLTEGTSIIDVTGLSKPLIFSAVRAALIKRPKVFLAHTRAQHYYPLDRDLAKIIKADSSKDHHTLLESLASVLTGEKGPYRSIKLLNGAADETRKRGLVAFSSAKHERLLSHLDLRDYDGMDIVAPRPVTPRSKVAHLAAEVAIRNYGNASLTVLESNDLEKVLEFLFRRYHELYLLQGLNVEFALTGSKTQAIACAVASAALKVSQAWYVQPHAFDPKRFTRGVAATATYSIELPD